MPGAARDIGIGANGAVWVIGTIPGNGEGNAIFHWNGQEWVGIEGAGNVISVDPNGLPVVINGAGDIFQRIK